MTLPEMVTHRKRTYSQPTQQEPAQVTEKKPAGKKIDASVKMKAGQRVVHDTFGAGTVVEDGAEIVKIRFDDGKIRQIMKSIVIHSGKLQLM